MQFLIALMLLGSDATASEPKAAQVSKEFLLSKHMVGRIKVGKGSSPESLYHTFNGDRDAVRLINRYFEGSFTPGIQVYINGLDIPAFVASYHWQRGGIELTNISVYDRRFKTALGIGVGSTLGDLRRHYTIGTIEIGEEAGLSAWVPELEISFELDPETEINRVPMEWWKTKDQTLIPDSAQIVCIWIGGG